MHESYSWDVSIQFIHLTRKLFMFIRALVANNKGLCRISI